MKDCPPLHPLALGVVKQEANPLPIHVGPYVGSNPFVQRIAALLQARVRESLRGAYIHGSLATGEEIAYSDFDGLLVVREGLSRQGRRSFRRTLRETERIMFELDPLQHHGWFILRESELGSYNEAYFPSELFAFSKSLLPDQGLELTLVPRDSTRERCEAFLNLARGVTRKVAAGASHLNMYGLKCLLSQFMLLPAQYLQVRDGRGIFKKFSFNAARGDFTPEVWECMDRVSDIRLRWHCPIVGIRTLLLSPSFPFRRQSVRRLAPPVPPDLCRLLTPGLFDDMRRLAAHMAIRLGLSL